MTNTARVALSESRFLERLGQALQARHGWHLEVHPTDGRVTIMGFGDERPHIPTTVVALHEKGIRFRPSASAHAAKEIGLSESLHRLLDDATFNNCAISCDGVAHKEGHHDAKELHTLLLQGTEEAYQSSHHAHAIGA